MLTLYRAEKPERDALLEVKLANMDIVGLLVEKFKEFQASQEFDKEALLEAHKKSYNSIRQIETSKGYIEGFTIRKPSEHWRPSIPLSGLRPIRARNLEIGMHQGRVLFGTLCADAHRMLAIMTVLEDQYGDAVRLAIYNPSLSTRNTDAVRRHYPKGSKVAVKEPYFKQGAQDGVLMLRVDNPQNVEFVTSFRDPVEASLVEDLLELRGKGNTCFRDEDWERAMHYYSRCIHLALSSHQKIEPQDPGTSNIQKEVMEALLYSYSNRAEARLKLKECQNAIEDCNKALEFDPHHLKSLFRKGRAFHALGEYKLACQCFERALEECPTANDIQLQYEKSMKLNEQNQQGKFDLSAYFVNGCKPQDVPKVSNYIGPVLIKKSAGRGRGLFATDNVNVGDFLLVDNAIASSCLTTRRMVGCPENTREMTTKVTHLQWDLVAKIISSSKSSPRASQQLQYLVESEEMKVPPMDLFRINNVSWNNFDFCSQGVELDRHKAVGMMPNVACTVQMMQTDDYVSQNEQYGLWALPFFINHSCFPNANCLVVGEAMFIIAARKIAVGEEITVPYFDTFGPLFQREQFCSLEGFRCDCKRCSLERSLAAAEASPLHKIAEFVDSISQADFEVSDLALIKNAVELENVIDALSNEEKQMMRASFYSLYYNIFAARRIHSYVRTTLPSPREVFDGFLNVVPGSCICFDLFGNYPDFLNEEDETGSVLEKLLKVCITFMGKQEEAVLRSVLEKNARGVFNPGSTMFACFRRWKGSTNIGH